MFSDLWAKFSALPHFNQVHQHLYYAPLSIVESNRAAYSEKGYWAAEVGSSGGQNATQ